MFGWIPASEYEKLIETSELLFSTDCVCVCVCVNVCVCTRVHACVCCVFQLSIMSFSCSDLLIMVLDSLWQGKTGARLTRNN